MTKAGYQVNVISDCITSWDPKKIDEMLVYYKNKGAEVMSIEEAYVIG